VYGPGDREPTASVIAEVTALLLFLPLLTLERFAMLVDLERLATLVEREDRVQLDLERHDDQNVDFQVAPCAGVTPKTSRRR
jgi:hypothetical protein